MDLYLDCSASHSAFLEVEDAVGLLYIGSLVYEYSRNQYFFVGTPEPKRWHMHVPCKNALTCGYKKIPTVLRYSGYLLYLFYLFLLLILNLFLLILITLAATILRRHSFLLLYTFEPCTMLSPPINRLR